MTKQSGGSGFTGWSGKRLEDLKKGNYTTKDIFYGEVVRILDRYEFKGNLTEIADDILEAWDVVSGRKD